MTVSGNLPDFNALNDADKRAVAERVLRIKESGWKPFWCTDPTCTTGDPHALLDTAGDPMFVDRSVTKGPNGEPVADYYESLDTGLRHVVLDPEKVNPNEVHVGWVVVDPNWAHNHARRDQRLPKWGKPWTLFIMSGRGSGKTRTGVEFVTLCARRGLNGAILGRRGTELVNTHVAEILKHAHPDFMPVHWASKDLLEWPNGALTYLFSAEKPENIRSVNLSYAWVDEAAFMDTIETAWTNLKLATRIEDPANPIHYLITSTPTGTKWVMKMEDDEDVEVRRVSTYANRANLGRSYLKDLVKDLEGTRHGRQELHGEVLRDVEGSLWNEEMFVHRSFTTAAYGTLAPAAFASMLTAMDEVVVAVDPAGTANKRSDETGIIAVGSQHYDSNGEALHASLFSVLGDATIKGTPGEWASATFRLAQHVNANRIIAENNFGGEMVEQVLRDYAKTHPGECLDADGEDFKIEVVRASQSKETRAEGTVGKYEQGRVTHVTSPGVFGDLSTLEHEQTTWVPRSRGGRSPSPNRIDALVWAVRALETKVRFSSQMATGRGLRAYTGPAALQMPTVQMPTGPEARAVPKTTKPTPVVLPVQPKRFEGTKPQFPVKVKPRGVRKV